MEKRQELRVEHSLKVLIWGLDAHGTRFTQRALARNISGQGALLTEVAQVLRPGDLVGVQYRDHRARYRVVWSRDTRNGDGAQAAIQRLNSDACPWRDELISPVPVSSSARVPDSSPVLA